MKFSRDKNCAFLIIYLIIPCRSFGLLSRLDPPIVLLCFIMEIYINFKLMVMKISQLDDYRSVAYYC